VIGQLYQLLDQAVEAKKAAYRLMVSESRRYPEIAAFRAVPGVGPVGACRFSAYIQTPHRFSSKRKLWRYCGLGITNRSSDGKRLSRQRLDRQANGRLKDMSYKAYLGATRRRDDNTFKRCYHRTLARTHNATHARLTTQRKILAVLRAMWISGESYRDDAV
jgi:transposase